MLSERPSNQQITAYENGRDRAVIVLVISLVLLMVAIGFLTTAARTGLIPKWLSNGPATVLFLAWLGYVLVLTRPANRPPNYDPLDEDYLRQTIDIQQRRNRYVLLGLTINLFSIATSLTVALARGRHGPLLALVAGAFVVIVLLAIFNLTFGPGLFSRYRRLVTDELSRAQRAQAVQFGFVFAVMEMCAVLAAAAYRPYWGLVALPFTLTMAIALPAFYFTYLEWRSDRG